MTLVQLARYTPLLNHSVCVGAFGAAETLIKVLRASGLACGAGVLVSTYNGIYCSLLALLPVPLQRTHMFSFDTAHS